MESSKVYVEVVARFDKDGVMMPMAFVWEDGRKYEIDKVKSKERWERGLGSVHIFF